MTCRRLIVSGRVQGVGFRFSARDEARSLGLVGWVRNCSDGRVEALVAGPEEAVERFVTWCHRGPPGALVTDVDLRTAAPPEGLQGFSIRY